MLVSPSHISTGDPHAVWRLNVDLWILGTLIILAIVSFEVPNPKMNDTGVNANCTTNACDSNPEPNPNPNQFDANLNPNPNLQEF